MIIIESYVRVFEKRMRLIEEIAEIVADDLEIDSINIEINPSREMDKCDGFCYSDDTIEIVNKRAVKTLFKTIAHEMRHAYQYKNKLIADNGSWRGKRGKKCEFDGAEEDAYEYENVMWERFENALDNQ